MSFWRQLRHGVRGLAGRSAADRDVADEVEHYLEQSTAAHMARGLSRADAQRAARLEMGSVSSVREQVRGYGWENVVETLVADVRYAIRRLRAEPVFTLVAILTLALGIGGATAIFSTVNPILFEPLPYPEPDRIMSIWEARNDGGHNAGTFGMTHAFAERARSLEAIAAFKPWQPTMSGTDQPERLEGQRVGASYFPVLGVLPSLGRSFQEPEDRQGGPNVVVISDRLWRRRFANDPEILGRPILLNETPYSIIGVMPSGFENVLAPTVELWAPLQYDLSQGRAWGHHLGMVARLEPGIDAGAAKQELDALGHAVVKEQSPATYGTDFAFELAPLRDDVTRSVRPALLAILGAVMLILLMACVNVTNLVLARSVHRRGEFALRAALGASGRRLVRQVLTESLLLAVVGGAAGMVLAGLGLEALSAFTPPGLPRAAAHGIDGVVFGFGVAVTTLAGLAFGILPAIRAARLDPRTDIERSSQRTHGGHHRVRSSLVVAEVALALVLLVSSGLLLRSLERLFAVEPGFEDTGLLTLQVQASGHRFDDLATTNRFFDEALQAVKELPGVTAAAFTSQLPLSGDLDLYGVHFDPAPPEDAGELQGTFRYAVSPGYAETMGIPLRSGRHLSEHDVAGAPGAALISESMAKRRLPGVEPLGQRLRIGPLDGPLYTVVGVVGDVRQVSLSLKDSEAAYVPAAQWTQGDTTRSFVVRGTGPTSSLATAIRQAIWSVDKDQAIVRVAKMEDLLAASAAEQRFALTVFQVFAVTALILAAAGIYGVVSGSVAERKREIGVRAALGASQGRILGLVFRQGLVLTGLGVTVGLAGAVAASQSIRALLFGTSSLDPAAYLGAMALLTLVALVACGLPAWRATRVDPASALRAD